MYILRSVLFVALLMLVGCTAPKSCPCTSKCCPCMDCCKPAAQLKLTGVLRVSSTNATALEVAVLGVPDKSLVPLDLTGLPGHEGLVGQEVVVWGQVRTGEPQDVKTWPFVVSKIELARPAKCGCGDDCVCCPKCGETCVGCPKHCSKNCKCHK